MMARDDHREWPSKSIACEFRPRSLVVDSITGVDLTGLGSQQVCLESWMELAQVVPESEVFCDLGRAEVRAELGGEIRNGAQVLNETLALPRLVTAMAYSLHVRPRYGKVDAAHSGPCHSGLTARLSRSLDVRKVEIAHVEMASQSCLSIAIGAR